VRELALRGKYTKQAKRWIIKIGSALLTKDGRGLDYVAKSHSFANKELKLFWYHQVQLLKV